MDTFIEVTPVKRLISFIVDGASTDGVYVLSVSHLDAGEPAIFTFSRIDGFTDCNPLELTSFLNRVESIAVKRAPYKTLFLLTKISGDLPLHGAKNIRVDELRGARYRYGWLIDPAKCIPLSKKSLRSLVGSVKGTHLISSNFSA